MSKISMRGSVANTIPKYSPDVSGGYKTTFMAVISPSVFPRFAFLGNRYAHIPNTNETYAVIFTYHPLECYP